MSIGQLRSSFMTSKYTLLSQQTRKEEIQHDTKEQIKFKKNLLKLLSQKRVTNKLMQTLKTGILKDSEQKTMTDTMKNDILEKLEPSTTME